MISFFTLARDCSPHRSVRALAESGIPASSPSLRQFVLLHFENFVFEFPWKALRAVHAKEAALRFVALSENRLAISPKSSPSLIRCSVVSLFSSDRESLRLFPWVLTSISRNATCSGRTYSALCAFVIFRYFLVADGDVRTDLAADYPLRQQSAADIVLEILQFIPWAVTAFSSSSMLSILF